MKIAIYSRKSRLSDKGESIQTQIDLCKNYILNISSINSEEVEFIIYKDEGFSGSNMDRPAFKELISDAKNDKFKMLICYRLDRISRNVADFSNTYELLNQHHIEFVSVKEQFDTSSPIGRAMLNIAMVFAQLERETTAERIRDNMLSLAKTGRWLGGKTPTGYVSKQINYAGDVNSKKMFVLEIVPEEMAIVKLIFDKFIELKSLRGVETYLTINDIKSPNGSRYTTATLRDILNNPTYAAADADTYNYFLIHDSQISNSKDEFTGQYGLKVYNRTNQLSKNNKIHIPIDKWIVAIGQHTPVISGNEWIYIQNQLERNSVNSFYNKKDATYGVLASLIKCGNCGATMKIKKGKVRKDGTQAFVYVCSNKDISRCTKCNIPNVQGYEADRDVMNYLIQLAKDEKAIDKILNIDSTIANEAPNKKAIDKQLNEVEFKIKNLMDQLSQIDVSSSLFQIYLSQLKELDKNKQQLLIEIDKINDMNNARAIQEVNIKLIKKTLSELKDMDKLLTVHEQRTIIRNIVDKIVWDGKSLKIEVFGQRILKEL